VVLIIIAFNEQKTKQQSAPRIIRARSVEDFSGAVDSFNQKSTELNRFYQRDIKQSKRNALFDINKYWLFHFPKGKKERARSQQ
jgi:hypothetical protein